MSATRNKASGPSDDETPASIPQTTPTGIGYGHPEYQFVQAIMEMQKSLGEINASILALTKSQDSTKAKVDDLVRWKNMILGGAIAIGILVSSTAFLVSKFSSYITIKAPETQTQHVGPATAPATSPAK